jgi:Family of unknown function (DUF5681)
MAKFTKGVSGNPKGRPTGSRGRVALLADQLFDDKLFGPDNKAAALIDKAIQMAEGGDAACMRLVFERIAPARKDRPVHFALPVMKEAKDAVSASAAIVAAVAVGELTPAEAGELAKVVDGYARTLQALEFEDRLVRLEGAIATR